MSLLIVLVTFWMELVVQAAHLVSANFFAESVLPK